MLLWKSTLNIKIRSALLKNKTFNSFTKIISLWTCWKDQIGALCSKVEKLPTQLCKCRKREGLGWHNLRGAAPPSSPRAKTFKRSQTPETMTGGQALKTNCPDLSLTSRMIPKMCSEDSWIIFFNEFSGHCTTCRFKNMRQVARNSVPSKVPAHSLYGAWHALWSIFLLPGFTYSNVTYFIQALPTTWSRFSLLWRFPHLNSCLTCSMTHRLALHNVLHLLPVWLLSEMLVFCSSSCEKSHSTMLHFFVIFYWASHNRKCTILID